MGTEDFLRGSAKQTFANIEEAIEKLREASRDFVSHISRDDTQRAGSISVRAFECFDHIVNELLRVRDDRKGEGKYIGTTFEQRMGVVAAAMVERVSPADQAAIASAGAGHGRLPAGVTPTPISLEKTLNKIKHRHRTNLNFRIDAGRHIFVVCPNNPDSIIELDVVTFCNLCRSAAFEL